MDKHHFKNSFIYSFVYLLISFGRLHYRILEEKIILRGDIIKKNNIYNVDCFEGLKELKEESVDSIVTDPPYNLSFMDKKWDDKGTPKEFQKWNEGWARLAYKVLKPGGYMLVFGGTRTYHRMVSGVEDAGFEIKDMIEWMYGCYSSDTECLTKKGWKSYSELTMNDEIMQWDSKNNELTFAKPLDIIIKPYEGKMYRFANRHTDQLVTPNHRIYAKIRKHSRNPKPIEYEVVKAENIKKYWQKDFPLAGIYEGNININSDYAYLVGWWLTDAWIHGDEKACMFSQSKKETLNKLRTALENYDCNYSEYIKEDNNINHQNEHTFYVTGKLSEQLLSEYPNRNLNIDMLNWDLESRKALVGGLMDGDGTTRKNQYAYVFWSKNKERLEIFQLLVMSLGYRTLPDYNKGCIHFNINTNTTQLQLKHIHETIDYNDNVWCLKTETGAFVVRRNGKIFISGNSGFPKNFDISKGFDNKAGAERTEGKRIWKGGKRHSNSFGGGSGQENGTSQKVIFDKPVTKKAKKWEGWGTATKPAHEPILLAQKPREGTYCNNIDKYDCGGINIDKCRVNPNGDNLDGGATCGSVLNIEGYDRKWMHDKEKMEEFKKKMKDKVEKANNKGRFPANLLLTHHPKCEYKGEKKVKGSKPRDKRKPIDNKNNYGNSRKSGLGGYADENGKETISDWNCVEGCPIRRLNEQSGISISTNNPRYNNQEDYADKKYSKYGKYNNSISHGYNDKGGAARYFNQFHFTNEDFFKYTAKASKSERTCDGNVDNDHPTVKPLELAKWLIRLVTPKDGLTVDSFCGSGTFPVAAYLEEFDYIGMEKDRDSFTIAVERVNYHKNKPIQKSLF